MYQYRESSFYASSVGRCMRTRLMTCMHFSSDDEIILAVFHLFFVLYLQLTPEIVTHCLEPINQYCENGAHLKGKTLHCLMEQYKGKFGQESELNKFPKCKEALQHLIKVIQILGALFILQLFIVHRK